jgi:hypothetical protein
LKTRQMASKTTRSRREYRRAKAGVPARIGRGSYRLAAAARSFAAKILNFALGDQEAADLAGRWRLEIDAQERRVVQWFAPAKQAAFRAHAAICRQEKQALAPYREARRVLNAKLAAWHGDQERGSQPPTGRANANGSRVPAAVRSDKNAVRAEGVSFRENWCAEVTDKLALVAAVAANPELANLLEPNPSALAHLARAHKGALNIPGVRVWCERVVIARRGIPCRLDG